MEKEKSVYQEIKERFPEVETDHHESDLYIKHTPEVWDYVKSNYDFFGNVKTFRSAIDGSKWIDIPFAYDPFWNKKLNIK